MITGNEEVYPCPSVYTIDGRMEDGNSGITIRQHFAALAMQGIVSNSCEDWSKPDIDPFYIARAAIKYADALITELNKTQ